MNRDVLQTWVGNTVYLKNRQTIGKIVQAERDSVWGPQILVEYVGFGQYAVPVTEWVRTGDFEFMRPNRR